MKRILLFLVLTATTLWSCAQPLIQRSSPANTINDPRHMASKNSIAPRYKDTTEANLAQNIGLDSSAAIIYTYDIGAFWYRQHSPKRWVRFSDLAASGVVQNISIINDSSVLICSAPNACDTLNFDTHIVNITSTFFFSDTALVVCNPSGACDTVPIPRQPISIYQNALTKTGDITEWGGPLVHNTTVDAGYYSVFFSGATLSGYPYRFYQQQGHQGSTGIVSFERAGNYTSPNAVALGVHSWDSTRQNNAEAFIPGYFGRRTGYALVTNFQSSQRPGWAAVAPDTSSKVSGLFLNTDDGDKNNEAFTLFGLSEADMAADQVRDSLAKGKILTGRTSGDITLWKYPSTRNDGALTKALGTDASGNVILGTLPSLALTADNGLTASSATNVQLGGTLLKNTTIAAGAYTLSVSGNGSSSLLQVTNSGTGGGVFGTASGAGTGVYGSSGFGTGIGGYSANGLAGFLGTGQAAANTAVMLLKEQRETSGTAADGIGYYRSGYIEGSGGPLVEAFREGAKLSTAANATATALYEMELVSAGTLARKLALAGSGKLTLDTYGDGLHTGTPTYALASDVNGNVIEVPVTTAVTANNGLSINTGANVQLGGTLIQNTTITGGTNNFLIQSSATTHGLQVTNNSATGNALYVHAANGRGLVAATASFNPAVDASGATGPAYSGTTTNSVVGILTSAAASGSDVREVLLLQNSPSVTAAAGLGSSLVFKANADNWSAYEQGSLRYSWTNATAAAYTSKFEIWGTNATTQQALLRISGAGVFTLVQGLPTYADNAAAITGGMQTNQLYKTASGVVMMVYAP
jgi:hypothetical protein